MHEYAELCEELDHAEEALWETEMQHKSECSLYGDSWPGAQIQIQQMRDGIDILKRQLKDCPVAYEIPDDADAKWGDFDDIPF